MALIFAREVSDPLTSLVKQIEKQLVAVGQPNPKLGIFIVFCSDNSGMKKQLQNLITKESLKQVVFCITNSAGPPKYQLAKEADLTVVVYNNRGRVAANLPVKKAGLDGEKSKAIINALNQVLPKK